MEGNPTPRAKRKNQKLPFIIITIIAVAGIASTTYLLKTNYDLRNNPRQLQEQQEAKVRSVKEKVGKLIDLPEDEEPVLMTVSDETKLQNQPFFKDAKNGDQILIYAQAKKAIMYRESDNKLINVGPIAITSEATDSEVDN